MEAVWKKVKSAIRDRIPKHSFQMWIEPLELEKAEDDNWILACPNFFSKKRVQDLYAELTIAELNKATRDLCKLSCVIGGNRKPAAGTAAARRFLLKAQTGDRRAFVIGPPVLQVSSDGAGIGV